MSKKDLEIVREAIDDALAEIRESVEISQRVEEKLEEAQEILDSNYGTE